MCDDLDVGKTGKKFQKLFLLFVDVGENKVNFLFLILGESAEIFQAFFFISLFFHFFVFNNYLFSFRHLVEFKSSCDFYFKSSFLTNF